MEFPVLWQMHDELSTYKMNHFIQINHFLPTYVFDFVIV